MRDPLLELRNLRKSFGALIVTDDVDLDVAPGDLHAIIGPNGAGKTTLIHQISGLLRRHPATIRLRRARTSRSRPLHERVRRGLARSFQITSILPGFSVLENVALAVQARSGSSFRFFGNVSGEKRLNDPAMDCLDRVALAAPRGCHRRACFRTAKSAQLELAIALATAPKVLLLDEPLAGTGSRGIRSGSSRPSRR